MGDEAGLLTDIELLYLSSNGLRLSSIVVSAGLYSYTADLSCCLQSDGDFWLDYYSSSGYNGGWYYQLELEGAPTPEPTPLPSRLPTPAPTILRDPDHEFDFRGCSDSSATADTGVEGTNITATATNGATCSSEGMVFDGSDDYVDVTPWPFGGEAMTVEAYVKFDAFDYYNRIFCFNDGKWNNQVSLGNYDTSGYAFLLVKDTNGNTGLTGKVTGNTLISSGAWVHIVASVDGTTIALSTNNQTDGSETTTVQPQLTSRTYHHIGKGSWTSTVRRWSRMQMQWGRR